MSKAKFRTLRDEPPFLAGGVELKREVYITDTGKLTQELSMIFADAEHVISRKADFKTDDTNLDDHLAMLDAHWSILKNEFKEIMEQAATYYTIKKQNGTDVDYEVSARFLDWLAPSLLEIETLKDDASRGKFGISFSSITTLNERLESFRRHAKKMGVELDSFEKAIMGLRKRFRKAEDAFEDQMDGEDDDSDMDDDDFQFVTGDDGDDEDAESWRGDEHKANDESWRGDEHLETEWNEEEKDEHEQGVDDGDEAEGDNELTRLLRVYEYHLTDFIEAANRVWLDAASHIYNDEPVTKDERDLEIMRTMMQDSAQAYDEFKAELRDEGLAYDFRKGLDILENEEKGPTVIMQNIINTASSPSRLKIMIEKLIAKQNNDEMELG